MKLFLLALAPIFLAAAAISPFYVNAQGIPLSELSQSKLRSATASITTYHGFTALQLLPEDPKAPGHMNGGPLAIFNNIRFQNGMIDVGDSGAPAKGADESARGFIGVAFHVLSESRFEIIYLRPTNSHADDQLRRNHTTQYSSEPDWPWDRLRKESPGVYESWADMETGEWTHMRIVVHGTDALLFLNHASNPCLVVHDLKLGNAEGSIGLWMGQDTEGYFRNLSISRK